GPSICPRRCALRLSVRTPPFHGGERGSIPLGRASLPRQAAARPSDVAVEGPSLPALSGRDVEKGGGVARRRRAVLPVAARRVEALLQLLQELGDERRGVGAVVARRCAVGAVGRCAVGGRRAGRRAARSARAPRAAGAVTAAV